MTVNDAAVLQIGSGNYFTADYVSTSVKALPADLTDADSYTGFENVGHTALDQILAVASEGGDATTIGTLQNKTLRTTYATRTESVGFTLQQFDTPSLRLYYGANFEVGSQGEFLVPSDPKPVVATFLAVFIDGESVFAIYAPKAEIFRGDDWSAADTDSLVGLPLNVKFLKHGTNKWNYAITPLGDI